MTGFCEPSVCMEAAGMRHSACEFMALCSRSNRALPERLQPSTGARMEPSSMAEGLDLHKLLLCYVMNAQPLECTSCCFPRAVTCRFSLSYGNQMPLSVFMQSL